MPHVRIAAAALPDTAVLLAAASLAPQVLGFSYGLSEEQMGYLLAEAKVNMVC